MVDEGPRQDGYAAISIYKSLYTDLHDLHDFHDFSIFCIFLPLHFGLRSRHG